MPLLNSYGSVVYSIPAHSYSRICKGFATEAPHSSFLQPLDAFRLVTRKSIRHLYNQSNGAHFLVGEDTCYNVVFRYPSTSCYCLAGGWIIPRNHPSRDTGLL